MSAAGETHEFKPRLLMPWLCAICDDIHSPTPVIGEREEIESRINTLILERAGNSNDEADELRALAGEAADAVVKLKAENASLTAEREEIFGMLEGRVGAHFASPVRLIEVFLEQTAVNWGREVSALIAEVERLKASRDTFFDEGVLLRQEIAKLKAENTRLEAERDEALASGLADAVRIEAVWKEEQSLRLVAESRLSALTTERDTWKRNAEESLAAQVASEIAAEDRIARLTTENAGLRLTLQSYLGELK